MKKYKVDECPGFAPPRRRSKGFVLTAIYLLLGVTCFVLFAGPVLLAMAVVRGLANLSVSFGISFWMAVAAFVMPRLIELFILLQTGQAVQFVMRLARMLGN